MQRSAKTSNDYQNNENKKEINKIKTIEERFVRKDLIYETNKYVFNFQQFKTIKSFGESIFSCKITLDETDKKQSNLLNNIIYFNSRTKPRVKLDKEKKRNVYGSVNALMKVKKQFIMLPRVEYFH